MIMEMTHVVSNWGLNAAQARVATAPPGHLLVNAAAGTGKTRAMAARIIYLQRDLAPGQIMALSFSRAARAQLTERMQQLCNQFGEGSPVNTYTFHGLAHRIARLGAEHQESRLRGTFDVQQPGADGLVPLFAEQAQTLLQGIHGDWGAEIAPLLFSRAIDILRQKAYRSPPSLPKGKTLKVPGELQSLVRVPTDAIAEVWARYEVAMRRANAIDYPGLLLEALNVLEHPNGATRDRVRQGLRYLVVDEFQDTSRAMLSLLRNLAGENVYLNVVGDSDQTIFTFNGSEIRNILDFTRYAATTGLPVLEPIDLTENYRSTAHVLQLANRVLNTSNRLDIKRLEPAAGELPEPVASYRARNPAVALVHAPRLDLAADFVCTEVQRLIHDEGVAPGEIAVLLRKNKGCRREGDAVRELLVAADVPVAEATGQRQQEAAMLQVTVDLCDMSEFYALALDELVARVEQGDCDAYLAGQERGAVTALLAEAQAAGGTWVYEAKDLLIDKLDAETEAPGAGGVQIRTIHSAKGAEFRVVFLLYLSDGHFPHGKEPDVDEERRLLYVGVTRAQERLYVLGQPVTRGADFFAECQGAGVDIVEWLVPGGEEGVAGASELDPNWVDAVVRSAAEAESEEQEEMLRWQHHFDEETKPE